MRDQTRPQKEPARLLDVLSKYVRNANFLLLKSNLLELKNYFVSLDYAKQHEGDESGAEVQGPKSPSKVRGCKIDFCYVTQMS
jgi:hypothetical protein